MNRVRDKNKISPLKMISFQQRFIFSRQDIVTKMKKKKKVQKNHFIILEVDQYTSNSFASLKSIQNENN